MEDTMPSCYLLHFTQKVRGNCGHYLGYTTNGVEDRLATHRKGKGARIIKQLMEEGGDFMLVRIWEDVDHWYEIRLKAQKNGRKLCPVCNGGN